MDRALDIAQAMQSAVFIALGIIAVYAFSRRRSSAGAWFALTFLDLAVVVTIGLFTPEVPTSSGAQGTVKVLVALLVLFPYLLFRMAGGFKRFGKVTEIVAGLATAAVAIGPFLFERLPTQEEDPSSAFRIYILALVAQWAFLLGVVAARLWRGSRGQASIVKRRMRTIALGAVGLAVAVSLSGTTDPSTEASGARLIIASVSMMSALLLLLGFSPPRAVRIWWRGPEEGRLRRAARDLLQAETPAEVADILLPHYVALAGGRGAALVGGDGSLVSSHQLSGEEATAALATTPAGPGVTTIPWGAATLYVLTDPYAPYFGAEEEGFLRELSVMAELALDRCELLSNERSALAKMNEAQRMAGVGSWEWDVAADKISWSEQLFNMYGVSPADFGSTYEALLRLVHPEDRGVIEVAVDLAYREHLPFNLEHRILRPDGKVRFAHARGKVEIDDQGQAVRIIGTAQDITARKEQELFRERFIANAAHELRTPLTSLLGLIEILADRRERMSEGQMNEAMEVMARGGKRLGSLVDNLLDLTKLQEGQKGELESVKLLPVVHEVLDSDPPPAGTAVAVSVESDLQVQATPARVDQIISNLLTNAYKYGGSNVTVEASRQPSGVLICVADDGPGVDPSLVSTLFEPFTRGEGFQSVVGSGLGLALVTMVVEVLEGRIWYEDAIPGAKFSVLLPEAS